MNYLANSLQAEDFIEQNEALVLFASLDEGHFLGKKGNVSIYVNSDYEITAFEFQESDRRKHKYMRVNSRPLIKNPAKKIIPIYIHINYEGTLWWCIKKFINLSDYPNSNNNNLKYV